MKCKYCGQSAGLLSKVHKECQEKHEAGLASARNFMAEVFRGREDINRLRTLIPQWRKDNFLQKDEFENITREALSAYIGSLRLPISPATIPFIQNFIARVGLSYDALNRDGDLDKLSQKIVRGYLVDFFRNRISLSDARRGVSQTTSMLPLSYEQENDAYYQVLNKAASNFLSDGNLNAAEEAKINEYVAGLGISTTQLPVKYQNSEIAKLSQVALLNQIRNGIIPQYSAPVPIMLGAREKLIWEYSGVSFLLERVQVERRGRTGGMSFRICKGVYYRTGQFNARPVERRFMENVGTGSLYITDKNLIFYSPTKNVKIPLKKVIGITPYSDGIEIHEDGARAKRMVVQGFDPWFLMNVLSYINI